MPRTASGTSCTSAAPSTDANTSSMRMIGEQGTAASSSARNHDAASRFANASSSSGISSSRCSTRASFVANRVSAPHSG